MGTTKIEEKIEQVLMESLDKDLTVKEVEQLKAKVEAVRKLAPRE